ncbi:M24 family metallopeptidase [Microbacterium sp. zg.Y625]|uniref:M24 family metallopeptidase n=1 Tax=Microbacterium jiangjiandongii TaxID=3049071 RepID=UPI00214B6ED1|nr:MULTISPECIES: M24 family metallopeptidase [unclassified Microbacterium]MCR2792257.1 M24 family metallopeptidase [Microbacterium sp. zg.Y625]WIM25058.1 M24 family metallopeptidase [Microbacterium sp. zg-Y625]
MPSPADRRVKQQRLARVRSDAGAGALVLTSHEAVSWYLDGVRTHVSLAGPPVLAVRVDDDGDHLFVAANEADRLAEEELLPDDAARIVRVPWQTPPTDAATAVGPAMTEAVLAGPLRAARASLLPGERDRYRALGRQTAEAMTDAARTLTPGSTERTAASALAAALVARGIDPLVILVAGRSRLGHRHPLPTDAPLGDRAMLVVCGRRHGLIANATRWVGAAGPDDERILAVEADFLAATRPGAVLSDAFARGCAAYAAHGFDDEEWTRHHQGGPTGYAGRDPRATAQTLDPIVADQAFAWNPSAPGAKVEDTVLIGDDGIEVLTADPRWPTVTHAGRARPTALPFS